MIWLKCMMRMRRAARCNCNCLYFCRHIQPKILRRPYGAYKHLEETRWRTPLVQMFIRMHNDKNSAMIIGAVVYVAVNVKHTKFCIYNSTLPKIHITTKKGSNKSCLELNFLQKSSWACMSISQPPLEWSYGVRIRIQL